MLFVPLAAGWAAEPTYLDALAAARQAMQQGDLHLAEIQMRNAVRAFPNNPDVHTLLAQIYLKVGNSPAAEDEARLARWHGGDDDDVAPVLAQAMLEQNKLGELIKTVQPGARAMKAEATVRLSLGLAHLGLGETGTGEALLRDAKRLDPTSEQSNLGMARLLMVKGDYAGAERELQSARAVDPDAIDVLRLAADLARSKGDVEGAIAAYGNALAKYPADLGLRVGRAMIFISVNRLAEAQTDVDAALTEAPFSLTPNFLAGLLLARAGKLQEADDKLLSVSSAFDALPNGYYLLGAVQYALGQYETAIANLTLFIARRPDHLGARRLLAKSALKMHAPLRAIEVLRAVAYDNPADRDTLALLAQAYIAANQKDEAVALYAWAAKAKPDDPRTRTAAAVMQLGAGDPIAGSAALEQIAASDSGLDVAGPILVLNELQNGRLSKAAAAAERLVARDANDLVALNMLATVREAQLKYDEAERLFLDIAKRDPDFLAARRNLAQLYAATDRPDKAKETYQALLKLRPNDVPSMMALAELAAAAGNRSDAAQWLAKAQEATPGDPSPSVRLVQLYAANKDWAKALAAARALQQKSPQNPAFVELVAEVRAGSGDQAGAVGEYQALVQAGTTTVGIYHRLAAYQLRAGDPDKARVSLQRALALAPDDESVMTDLVDLAFDNGGADSAVAVARSFATRAPELADLLAANALVRAKRRDEAIALLRDGQRWHPAARNAGRLAELTFDAGQHDAAKTMLRALLQKHEELPALLSLANMDMLDLQYDEAQASYERALERSPNQPVALNNLAWLYARKHDPRATELALNAYRVAPGPRTSDTLGWVLVGGGDQTAALPYLERAAAGQPQDPEVQYHLAVALEANGAAERARTLLERIVGSTAPFSDRDDAARRLKTLGPG